MQKTVVMDAFPESALRYRRGYAVVAIDVIRATTMAATAVAMGRRCFVVTSINHALELATRLRNPILAGEIAGDMPSGFDMNNSPAELAARTDVERPLILLSSSGTQLIHNARHCETVYLASFRDSRALARWLISESHPRIALIGAGSRGEFREEDQICCAWIAERLVRAGYVPQDSKTMDILNRWGHASATDCLVSRSVDYLRRTGQIADLQFILEKVDDLDLALTLRDGEIVTATPAVLPSPHIPKPAIAYRI